MHRQWTTENGLPQNSVTAILQTRDGYLWLGTLGGLVRFDGVTFTVFDPENTPGLKSARVVSLFEDRAGGLWICTEQGGVSRYFQGRFTNYTEPDSLPDFMVSSIGEDADGNLWIGTRRGLVRLTAGRFKTYTTQDGLPGNDTRYVHGLRNGGLWVATNQGLAYYRENKFTVYTKEQGVPGYNVRAMHEARDGTIWFATDSGAARFRDGVFSEIDASEFLRRPIFKAIWEDEQGGIYLAGRDGIVLAKDGTLSLHYPPISDLEVYTFRRDREGNIWVGSSWDGLYRLKPPTMTVYGKEDGFADAGIMAVVEDGAGGMWLASEYGGLFHYRAGSFEAFRDIKPVALLRDRNGDLWAGGKQGLLQLRDGQEVARYDAKNHPALAHAVRALFEDRTGTIWIGTVRGAPARWGLIRFRNGQFTAFGKRDGLVHEDVRFIIEDRQGALWIGTTAGLSRFKDGQFTNYTTAQGLLNGYVRAIYEDAEGTFWIGTYGGGLHRFRHGRFVAITMRDGLFDNTVSRILEDSRGNLWMTGNRGIFHARRRELNDFADGKLRSVTSIGYGVADGLKSAECNGGTQPAGWQAADGRLWLPTIKGIAVIDPAKLNDTPPPVMVERALVDRRPTDVWTPISAAPGEGNLELHYTALNFTAPEKVRFKYRLEGYDDDWVEAGTRRVAYYTNLAPGQYTFRVIACNNDGVWNETGAGLPLYLRPHFYQTKLFYACCLLLLGLAGAFSYRWRVRRLLRRTQELEHKVSERTAVVVRQKDELAQANAQLGEANGRLERANDDLLAILDQLRLGVAITERDGAVTYLSQAAQQLIGKTEAEALGERWPQLLPLDDGALERLKAMAARPPAERGKLLARLQANGQHYWTEIEVQDDPRDTESKILFLYDVSEIYDLRLLLGEKSRFHDLVGESVGMQLVYKQVRDLAPVDTTVLITGETGTGKELVARALHAASPRAAKPFVALNCAGLTESLVAGQLFGHRRGAFTGAVADQVGVFEAAQGGTVFLDEIGDIPPTVQTALLRVLQEREITRLGEAKPRKVDVRVIAATHRDLEQEVAAGRFRSDLLYRICVAQLRLPPLRERRQDIPLLAAWFLKQFQPAADKGVQDVSQAVMRALVTYAWPGNVRELKSAIETAAIRARGPALQIADLPAPLASLAATQPRLATPAAEEPAADKRQRIQAALEQTQGNRAAAARLLGVSRATLYRWLEELKIEKAN